MSVLDNLLAKDPESQTVAFCRDREARDALANAQTELAVAERALARARKDDDVKSAREEVDSLKAKVAELDAAAARNLVRFTLAAVTKEDFEDLKDEHPPTREQKSAAGDDKPEWNTDTFPPALIAASCVRVETPDGTADGLTLEEAQAIWRSRSYNEGERGQLFNAAIVAYLVATPYQGKGPA